MTIEKTYVNSNTLNYDVDYYALEEKPYSLVLKKEGEIILREDFISRSSAIRRFTEEIEAIWEDVDYRGVEDTRYSLILFKERMSWITFDNYGESFGGFLCFYSLSDCSDCEDTYIEKSSNKYYLQSRDKDEEFKFNNLLALVASHLKF